MKKFEFGCRGNQNKVGVLLAQLGTPDAPTAKALRPYLKQFLGDPRVIEKPRWLWWLILNCIILRLRPKRSARLYSRIWTAEGSPLLVITKQQTEALRQKLGDYQGLLEIDFGMRYGSYSLESAIDRLIEKGCSKIVLFNMYPQYSATTTAANYDAVFKHLLNRRWVPTLRVVEPYYDKPSYIKALADRINQSLSELPSMPEYLVFSYHGIPEMYVQKGDPYCCMCSETTRALLPLLSIPADRVIHTYQSRFGRDPWLVPYTDETIDALGKKGVKNIAVACPGFTADCLETLDELGNEGREAFHEHGGENLYLIPCLNDHPSWIDSMQELILAELSGWLLENQTREQLKCPVACAKQCAVC